MCYICIYIFFLTIIYNIYAFPGGTVTRVCLSRQEMQETLVLSLGQEVLLEKEMANHCSILASEIPWVEEPGGLQSPWGLKELDMTEHACTESIYTYTK